ncbi:MAG TPA: ABC transporter permease [Microbacteriaceae bacterium]|nr:ABC transporter permease [Microbacteriaceae bacterium]
MLRRLAFLLVSLAAASIVTFLLLRLLPGDPANALVAVGATPAQIQAARHAIGSDQPVLQQFITWAGQMARFDLGTSFTSGVAVGPQIVTRMALTLPLTLISFVVAVLIAAPVGFVAARYRERWFGLAASALSQLGLAVPVFWIGILLVWLFALGLHVLPAGGFPEQSWADPADAARSLVLPVVTIALVMSASIARYVRSASIEVIDSDFLRTFRALGASFGGAMLRHGLKSVAVPLTSVLGIELATTFLGAVVVENVFALPGLGSMLVNGIAAHDYPTIQGVILVTTLLVLVVGFLADLAQKLLDPRLRGSLL